MPMLPLLPCRTCRRATNNKNGFCDAHKGDARVRARLFDAARGNDAARKMYGTTRWKKLRLNQLLTEPMCAYCMKAGRVKLASVADHIEPHKGNPVLFFAPDNLQSLCKPCHDKTKQREEAQQRKAQELS